MPIPIDFISRLAIPLIVATFYIQGPQQAALYKTILEESDRVLSIANGDGEIPVENFDYIIVGAGSAGAVLANRLSASGTDSVLLLDAGGDPNPLSDIPVFTDYLGDAGMLLDYNSTRQEKSCGNNNGICSFVRGKALGGSSSVNGLVYNRCAAKDYDSWANFTGDPIWRFDSVVDAFRAIENYQGVYVDNPGPNHGTDGEMHVSHLDYIPGYDIVSAALEERGLSIGDINSGDFPSGFSKLDHNTKDGLRWSTFHGFLEPILNRTNLKIYRYAWVTKISINSTKHAVGVIYKRHGSTKYVAANKEIILSAGPIDSPKLLMLSGLGPREHLAEHGIDTIVDLPAVGNYLQEHTGPTLYPFAINRTIGLLNPLTPENVNEYILNATGPLSNMAPWSSSGVHIVHGNFPSRTYNDPSWPDLHAYINQVVVSPQGKPIEQQIVAELELVRTEQIGTVKLASSNPDDYPIIDPHILEDPSDKQRLIEGIEFLLDFFFNSTTFQALGLKWSENAQKVPKCESLPFPSTEYWSCYLEVVSGAGLHPTSSYRMGPNNSVAVVDSRLRVFGTIGLRVIDSSVMPFVPSGNTNFPSIMIGEMGARIVLNQI